MPINFGSFRTRGVGGSIRNGGYGRFLAGPFILSIGPGTYAAFDDNDDRDGGGLP